MADEKSSWKEKVALGMEFVGGLNSAAGFMLGTSNPNQSLDMQAELTKGHPGVASTDAPKQDDLPEQRRDPRAPSGNAAVEQSPPTPPGPPPPPTVSEVGPIEGSASFGKPESYAVGLSQDSFAMSPEAANGPSEIGGYNVSADFASMPPGAPPPKELESLEESKKL